MTLREKYQELADRFENMAVEDDDYDTVEEQRDEALQAYIDSDEPRTWEFYGEGGEGHDDVECSPSELDLEEIVRDGSWDVTPEGGSIRLEVYAKALETGETEHTHITLDPEEPECLKGIDHEWSDDHSLVGGCEASPGVWGNGAGTISNEVCVYCGTKKISRTCSQGQYCETDHDFDSVRYETEAASIEELAEYHNGLVPDELVESYKETADEANITGILEYASYHSDRDTSHEDASEWWNSLDGGSPCDFDEVSTLSEDDMDEDLGRTAQWWKTAAENAQSIADSLDAAVKAWENHDIQGCVENLKEAHHLENEYGDDPATHSLAGSLLGENVWNALK